MLVRHSLTAVMTDRQAMKSSACNLATLCYYNVVNLISKSPWWTNTYRLSSFIPQTSQYQSFFLPLVPFLALTPWPVARSSTANILQTEWNPTCKNPLRSKARLPTAQRIWSFWWCWSTENLNFSRSITTYCIIPPFPSWNPQSCVNWVFSCQRNR